jgi:hypothetical protein
MKTSLINQNRVNRHVISSNQSRFPTYGSCRVDLMQIQMHCVDFNKTGTKSCLNWGSGPGACWQTRLSRPRRGISIRRVAVASSSDNAYNITPNGDEAVYMEATRGPMRKAVISNELKQVLGLALPGVLRI